MRTIESLAILVLLLAALAAAPNKAKVHGFDLSGTVAGLDQSRKTLVVQSPTGKQTKLFWTNATSSKTEIARLSIVLMTARLGAGR